MLTYTYINTPNLPDEKVSAVLVDFRISKDSVLKLEEQGIDVFMSAQLNSLYDSVSGHPDMQIHHLGDNLFVCEPTLYNYYSKILKGAHIIQGNTYLDSEYPHDIAYNVVKVGKLIFHNFKYTDSVISEYYANQDVKLINVKQGYSKCSVCVLNDKAIITSDAKIAKISDNYNIDALYFSPEKIRLNGVSNGLIGGICGKISSDILAINGNIEIIDNNADIRNFCSKYAIQILNLNNRIPYDIGSIIPLSFTNKCS